MVFMIYIYYIKFKIYSFPNRMSYSSHDKISIFPQLCATMNSFSNSIVSSHPS